MTISDSVGVETTHPLPNLEEVLAAARANSLTRDNPLLTDLPEWFKGLRDHQRVAIREILTAYEEGAECVVLDAPTGSGKTLIGETVRRLLHRTSNARQTSYICSSKALQDQFIRDYPYAKVLKGRSNYATESFPERFGGRDGLSAADCTKQPGDSESCLWCASTHLCPYEIAKHEALAGPLAVLNTSYFLSECNGPGRFSRGGLVIADECLAAGTLISTPDGPKVIEDIQVGDTIWGEKDGRVVKTTVKRVMANEGTTFPLNGLEVTGNHSLLTTRGYVPASQISPLDKIAVTGLNPSHGTILRMVPTALPGEEPAIFQRKAAEVLWKSLLRGVEENTTEGSPQRDLRILSESIREHEENTEVLQPAMREQVELAGEPGKNGWSIGEIYGIQEYPGGYSQTKGVAAESRQSDLRPCCPATSIRDAIGSGVQSSEWRQWYRTNSTSEDVGGRIGVAHRSSSENRQAASTLLQDRCGKPRINDWGGGRRRESPQSKGSESGQAEDRVFRESGVGDPPSPEQEGIGELGVGGRQDSSCRVYNLSTGTHNYIANGIVVHNCDTLESELMSHVEVRISERRLKSYGLGVPKYVTKEESWREWAEEAYEKVSRNAPRHANRQDIVAVREAKRHSILMGKLDGLRKGLATGGWVYTGTREQVAFKPVAVDSLGQDKFWRHGDKFLLMSATVISADELLESLGWSDEREWRLVKCPSTFRPENRKVVVWPVASMTWKEKDTSYPKLAEAVKTVIDKHPDDRVLVHSTSYELTRYLEAYLIAAGATKNPSSSSLSSSSSRFIISYSSAAEKDSALEDYLSIKAAVMIAPSLDRGIDLPGDACRVQIICKVPFLNLQDKQVSGRLYGTGRSGKTWYAVNAIRTIVQMTGRAVRSEEDFATTYILDRQFVDNIWYNWKRLIPAWWREGIEWKMKGL